MIAKETALSIVQEMKTASGCDINLMDETARIRPVSARYTLEPESFWKGDWTVWWSMRTRPGRGPAVA